MSRPSFQDFAYGVLMVVRDMVALVEQRWRVQRPIQSVPMMEWMGFRIPNLRESSGLLETFLSWLRFARCIYILLGSPGDKSTPYRVKVRRRLVPPYSHRAGRLRSKQIKTKSSLRVVRPWV